MLDKGNLQTDVGSNRITPCARTQGWQGKRRPRAGWNMAAGKLRDQDYRYAGMLPV